ncbi:MAG: hemolysin [Rhodanobacter sp. 68-29]|uniref:hemolysin family protein n=1 Tax=Rhodanobacter sp. PCA2 TaxID=2006117 RepID=UPI000868806A|nr:hemolysin family protein [Rhodanobacter sp. PCA2]MBA2079207.1 hemolysin [Rhodanobacter sp. PCA2]MBN8922209.1 HlyC/CorC family transporter [Rhodanobacter sp.]ODU73450.1 MAG: hemolysin [Rhodanobacter sp. SCN 69-32]OJY55909.1 MAG: hemolysin [Rhodanobacter sp. 68-29]
MLTEIAFVFVLALCNGFFALSEMALVASRKSRLKQMARSNRGAAVALRHAEKPEYFLSTIQVGITLMMLVTGAVAGDALGTHIAALLHGGRAAWLEPYARVIGVVLGFVLISFIQIVVGELVPKRLALSAPEKLSSAVAIPMLLLSRVTAPFVWLLNTASSLLLRLMGVRNHGHAAATEEEIRLLVAESAEQGVLDADEHAMVNRVLRLGDRSVDSVMTPRVRIAWLDMAAPREENVAVLRQTPYSCYPVYRDDESEVVGVVEVKRLLQAFAEGRPQLFDHLAKPLYVPATARAFDLLEEFRDAETPLALVVDEYGDIQGLVTVNDLLAAVVGASQLGHGGDTDANAPIVRRADGSWLVDGSLANDDLRELLQVDQLPGEGDHDFRTVAGMVMAALGHIPQVGEVYAWQGIRFEVVDLDGARIDKLLVTRTPPPGNADEAEG